MTVGYASNLAVIRISTISIVHAFNSCLLARKAWTYGFKYLLDRLVSIVSRNIALVIQLTIGSSLLIRMLPTATGNLLPTPSPASNSHTLIALPSSVTGRVADTTTIPSDSEDELSEAAESPVILTEYPLTVNAIHTEAATYTSDISSLHHDDDDADGSDDADFDNALHPRSNRHYARTLSSSENAQGHSRSGASPEDEEYMRRNPELYGLRRSVSNPIHRLYSLY